MSEPGARLNSKRADEPPKNTVEPPLTAGAAESPDGHDRLDTLAVVVIVAFWSLQFIYFSLDKVVRLGDAEGWATIGARAVVSTFGALISFGILKILKRCMGVSFLKRAMIALALAYAGSAIHSLINWAIFLAIIGPVEGGPFSLSNEAASFPPLFYLFSWVYLAITVLLLSLTYGEELIQRERRIAQLIGDADRARLSALRYQLNPHFLFNALNSAASLVSAERNREAELMLENLADFLRATAKLDPEKEITVREEIALQTLYLDVERVRFPHRLRVQKDVEEDVLDALVPNLITQPLIENSVKHALARSTGRVTVRIAVRDDGGRLRLEISDSGGNSETASEAAGVGLRNVVNRLRLHFGGDSSFECGPTASGGFRSAFVIPLRRRG